MEKLISKHKPLFKKRNYQISFIIGIIFLLLAVLSSIWAIHYSDIARGDYVGDFILDNLPQFNFFEFRIIGTGLITFLIITTIFLHPRKLPFTIKTISLMYIIRAFFISLTHLKAYPKKVLIPSIYPSFDRFLFEGNDLFFSGHVALPFIVALIFWENKKIRNFFLGASIFSGIASLLAKTHYSIDIFAAPFIAYAIFKISEKIFKKDFKSSDLNLKN